VLCSGSIWALCWVFFFFFLAVKNGIFSVAVENGIFYSLISVLPCNFERQCIHVTSLNSIL
jgi:hypothetical protein